MKRYAFPLTIILLLFAVIALAAPGDKRPAVTSAAIGLGTSSSPTLASVTATTSVTAPAFNSSAADGYHYVRPYNSIAFAGTPLAGMFVTTPTGPQWYTGSEWEAIGSGGGGTWGSITGTLSAQADLQAALDAISAGGITISTAIPTTAGAAYLNDTTHVLTVASSTGYTQFTGSFTAWDTTPDAFSFTDETDIAIGTAKTSNAITVAGTNSAAAISVTGDTGFGYSKNSAACTATSGTVVAGDTVAACVTSSGSNSTATTATVTIGGVPDTYSVTTAETSGGAYDNFTGTDNTALTSHTSDGSHTWGKYSTGTAATLKIIGNQLVWDNTTGNNRTVYYSSFIPTDADYSVFADMYTPSSASGTNYLCGRINTGTGVSVCARYTDATTGWQLFDTTTQIGTDYVGDIPTTTKNIEIRFSGTNVKLLIGGIERISATTSVSSAGSAGFATYYPSANTVWIDNWEVTD